MGWRLWDRVFGKKAEHAHKQICVGVDYHTVSAAESSVFTPAGTYTTALLRCEGCGAVASHTLRGRFTAAQINGVEASAVADALIESSKRPQ